MHDTSKDITVDILNQNLESLFQLNKEIVETLFIISKIKPNVWHILFKNELKLIQEKILSHRKQLQEIDEKILLRTFLGLNTSTHIISNRISLMYDSRNVILNTLSEAQQQFSSIESQIFFKITVLLSIAAITISIVSIFLN